MSYEKGTQTLPSEHTSEKLLTGQGENKTSRVFDIEARKQALVARSETNARLKEYGFDTIMKSVRWR